MNNVITPVPQFTGYPLKPFPPGNDIPAFLPSIAIEKGKAVSSVAKTIHLSEVQENWDEAWFANYE